MLNNFTRLRGRTETERILAELGSKTFFEPWSYPNLFKKKADELCDLLVVFENTVIIFSDKSCEYPCGPDAELNWNRWYRRSVVESVKQIRRAEGWLRKFPDNIYFDPKCEHQVSIRLPRGDSINVIRICVTLNGPSLGRSFTPTAAPGIPTIPPPSIGPADDKRGWIHVVDGNDLVPLFNELSTIQDFISYFITKEQAICEGRLWYAASELDLLAYYIYNNRTLPSSRFGLCLPWPLWRSLTERPEHRRRRALDARSLIWDELLGRLFSNYYNSSLEVGSDLDFASFEAMTRMMSRESRFARRCLSRWIYEAVIAVAESHGRSSGPVSAARAIVSEHGDLVYVLLVTPGSTRAEHAEHRRVRRQELQLRCFAAKWRFPTQRYFLGIALDASNGRGGSEDFILLDLAVVTEDEIRTFQTMANELEFFVSPQGRFTEDEYPAL